MQKLSLAHAQQLFPEMSGFHGGGCMVHMLWPSGNVYIIN